MTNPFAEEAGARPWLDVLDARTRIVSALAIVAAVLAIRSPLVLLAGLPALIALALACGLRLRDIAARMAHAEGFVLVLLLMLPLTVPGPAFAAFGPVEFSQPGLDRALKILLRVNLSALAVLILLAGLEPIRFGHALAGLGVPQKLTHLLLFSARWAALVRQEALRLHDALRARAFRASTSAHTLRTLGHFTGQLLVRALERAERVDEAMRCRGFAGRFALVAEERPGARDAVFAAAVALCLLGALVADRLT
ncbi:cobalt ECF transporter T component CbiQ [Rhodoblastus acidophilus]|uniref:Cobalt ECF transporter T component CbiQ n=1 Tax=Rhodoblastus acidophilus TaxID=1074 RepID=A0A6N8DNE9_RHOAC|nr:cobalt ECF transporter T component CbiQ [Rhodoblastus acidophilus]MCW2274474.1 cobalt/nickel transport system permease protein [Rhodoblastus acidophilus]MTV31075.1 cobalt ECF transporter T component CbiQ [Rhodoblastus acidophilus]